MTSDSTSSRLPLLLSACSCPAGGGSIQAQKVLHAVVAAAGGTGGQPSGMIPLISSHLILVSLASFPAKPFLASQGRASSSSSHPLSPLCKVPSKPQLSDELSHCHTTPLPCPGCHLRRSGSRLCDGFGQSRRPTSPRGAREYTVCTQSKHMKSLISQSDDSLSRTCLSALTPDWRRF